MLKQLRLAICLGLHFAVLFTLPGSAAQAQSTHAEEERAIREVLTRFYEGWNAHDVEKMVSAYAEDIDHINVFAQWHRGKAAVKEDLRQLHAGQRRPDGSVAPLSQKTFTIEKVRFIKSDVAVVHVRSLSTEGNLGTYVMTKESGEWLVLSFTNVKYDLPKPGQGAHGEKKPGDD
jgi:uncharacterized protein (TIGR02246 family)